MDEKTGARWLIMIFMPEGSMKALPMTYVNEDIILTVQSLIREAT